MAKLKLYTFFHLNLAYSSIPEEHYKKLVENCYWPLLRLAEDFPLGIEAPAHTLVEIEKIDGRFVKELKRLWTSGKCEFIGSGYIQAIFPLIPAQVNIENLAVGNKYYVKFFDRAPETALVNEQCYSKGLVELYMEAGYKNIIAEWNNAAKFKNYPKEYQYYPQLVVGSGGHKLNLIWNNSIAFQKFQRCVYGLIESDEYLEYFETQIGQDDRGFVAYGNDAEVFNYRPGQKEALQDKNEFSVMRELLTRIQNDSRYQFILPSEFVSTLSKGESSKKEIRLESCENPIPCKKQDKYNPSRWALCGDRNSVKNSESFKVYGLNKHSIEDRCNMWSSDFRTFTVESKLKKYKEKVWFDADERRDVPDSNIYHTNYAKITDKEITVDSEKIKLVLNVKRGLTVKSLTFKDFSSKPLAGTIPHGYYDDITYGADFYTGNIIVVTKDGKKVTDLIPVTPNVNDSSISCNIETPIGRFYRGYKIYSDRVDIIHKLYLKDLGSCSFRVGKITLIPDSFDRKTLFYAAHNGGRRLEKFSLDGCKVRQDQMVSQIVSSSGCLGATEGYTVVGDASKGLKIEIDRTHLWAVPLIQYEQLGNTFFFRVYHSISEMDETSNAKWDGEYSLRFSITPVKTSELEMY